MANVEDIVSEKLQKIFRCKKVSFDDPGEAGEQECLFINVENSYNSVRDKTIKQRVVGTLTMFGTNQKLPLGYFSKCIQEANSDDTKDFFFHDFESNTKRFKDKVQRGLSFVYFFSSQYDPEKGTLNSIEFDTEET